MNHTEPTTETQKGGWSEGQSVVGCGDPYPSAQPDPDLVQYNHHVHAKVTEEVTWRTLRK